MRYKFITDFLRADLETVISAQQETIARYVANDVGYKISERQALLETLATTLPVELLKKPVALHAWLAERYALQPLFSHGLFITDRKGVALADFPEMPYRVQTDYSDRDYFQAALQGKSWIGRPVVGRATKVPILPMATPIKNAAGEVQGVLVGITALSAAGFLDQLALSKLGKTGGFLLISPRDRMFITATVPEMVLKPTPADGVNALHDRAMQGYRGTGVTINAQGVEEISSIVSVPNTDWFVVARLPTAEAFAIVGRTQNYLLTRSLMVVLGFVFFACIGMYFVL
jgi:hypothetical protein